MNLHTVVNHSLTKGVIFISCLKTINTVGMANSLKISSNNSDYMTLLSPTEDLNFPLHLLEN